MAEERFGPYRIEGLIGAGAMGEVHRATDLRKDRAVALKRLSSAHSGDEGFATRFRREAEMTARLSEPHVIPIHDYGEIDGRLFLDMRLVEGIDLGTALGSQGPMDPLRAVAIVEQVAAALDAAHRAQLIHRDVKPSNILLADPESPETGAPGFAYLIDFGIASSLRDSRLTSQSTLIGTAGYMAPERFKPGPGGDHRVDVYALGCVLHEAVTGAAPFRGTIEQLMHAHLHAAPPRPGALRHDLPHQLDDVVATALEKEPEHRYQRAGELAAAARAAVSRVAPPGANGAESGRTGVLPSSSRVTGPTGQHAPPRPPGPTGSRSNAMWGPVAPPPTRAHDAGEAATSTTPTHPGATSPGATVPPGSGTLPGSTDDLKRPPSPTLGDAPTPPRRRRGLLIGAVVIVLLALLAAGGTYWWRTQNAGPAPAALPADLVGGWAGEQTEPGTGRTFPIRIDLQAGQVGAKVGQMAFSVYDCRFDLYLTAVAETTDLDARPVSGPCTEGLVRINPEGTDRFSYETSAAGTVVARGTMNRA
ncbi:serine/threonine-protein kinase [Actinomycetospora sp. C-140]